MQILASVTNFVTPMTFWRSFGWFAHTAKKSSVGLQWEMWHGMAALQTVFGLVVPDNLEGIKSLKQSSRSESWILQGWLDKNQQNRGLAVRNTLSLPHKLNSFKGLNRVQKLTRRELPITVYPDSLKGSRDLFVIRLMQPTAQIMRKSQLRDIPTLIEWMQTRSLRLCVDTYHLRRDASILGEWRDSLPKLLPYTDEIGISLGREPLGEALIDTQAELNELVQDHPQGELIDLLRFVRFDQNWDGTFVLKIPPWNFKSINEAIFIHQKIAQNIRNLRR